MPCLKTSLESEAPMMQKGRRGYSAGCLIISERVLGNIGQVNDQGCSKFASVLALCADCWTCSG